MFMKVERRKARSSRSVQHRKVKVPIEDERKRGEASTSGEVLVRTSYKTSYGSIRTGRLFQMEMMSSQPYTCQAA